MRPWLGSLIGLVALTSAAFPARSQTATPPIKAVVELFTSQGCSSCPPADALLKVYAARSDVIALSYSVDYWDHLGWKDTLASPHFTARQKAYGKSLASGNVYTPQVVVNGTAQAVGSNKIEIEKAIERTKLNDARTGTLRRVAVTGKTDGKKIVVEIGGSEVAGSTGTVLIAIVEPSVDINIKHGENRGRKLSYYNVVKDLTPVGMWTGKPLTVELPFGAALEAGKKCAVLLQSGETGPILNAAWIEGR